MAYTKAGKVCIGFSHPLYAKYSASGTTVTYSDVDELARGVNVALNPTVSDDNNFHADDVIAETVPGRFTGGDATMTVDGLLETTEKIIMGLAAASTITVGTETVNVYANGKADDAPYIGVGYLAHYMCGGVESWTPTILCKAVRSITHAHATQEENVNWQTQEITLGLNRDDTAAANWRMFAEDQDTEAGALAVLRKMLGETS